MSDEILSFYLESMISNIWSVSFWKILQKLLQKFLLRFTQMFLVKVPGVSSDVPNFPKNFCEVSPEVYLEIPQVGRNGIPPEFFKSYFWDSQKNSGSSSGIVYQTLQAQKKKLQVHLKYPRIPPKILLWFLQKCWKAICLLKKMNFR